MSDDTTTERASGPEKEKPAAPARRRLLVRAGIAALAVALLVGVPGYLSGTPAFLRLVPGLAAKTSTLAASPHAGEAGCWDCHADPGTISQIAARVKGAGALYVAIFSRSAAAAAFSAPSNASCVACHADLRTVSPKGDLKIPHRAHVEILKMRCVVCHEYLVHEKSPEGRHTPPMRACLKCHDGDRAKNSCSTCHTQKAAPEGHRAADWLVVHAQKAASDGCAKCHGWVRDWCASCHSQRPASHARDWRKTHGIAVAKHRDCEACHAGAFCVRCHGVVPQLNFDPSLKIVK